VSGEELSDFTPAAWSGHELARAHRRGSGRSCRQGGDQGHAHQRRADHGAACGWLVARPDSRRAPAPCRGRRPCLPRLRRGSASLGTHLRLAGLGHVVRWLANENVPRQIVLGLRALGHDVVWVVESGAGAADREVLARPRSEARTILTFDKDFYDLAVQKRAAAGSAVVLLRIADCSLMRWRCVALLLWSRVRIGTACSPWSRTTACGFATCPELGTAGAGLQRTRARSIGVRHGVVLASGGDCHHQRTKSGPKRSSAQSSSRRKRSSIGAPPACTSCQRGAVGSHR